jgi:hypothetical protein
MDSDVSPCRKEIEKKLEKLLRLKIVNPFQLFATRMD